ncbi:MAG: hypothetical protein MUE46_09080 [Xanthomonadales bacterium]|jgi:hypothetical protein|nr:hypothetical protein [Xanthomonadales bacterium]
MDLEISAEKAAEIISVAFLPLHCGVEVFDFWKSIRFRVFDENGDHLLRMDKLVWMDYNSVDGLCSIIEYARSALVDRGFSLDPWNWPI